MPTYSIYNAFYSGNVPGRGVEPYPPGCVIVLAFIRALALYIVRAMQPLSLVDCPHFNAFVKFIDPRFSLPCRNTITHTVLPDIYHEAKEKLRDELSKVDYVALTCDCWTSMTNDSYLTVTVHYINEKIKSVSRVLATVGLEERHTSINLAKRLKAIAAEWKITGNITIFKINFKNKIK